MGSKNEKSCEKCLSISHSFFYHMHLGGARGAHIWYSITIENHRKEIYHDIHTHR